MTRMSYEAPVGHSLGTGVHCEIAVQSIVLFSGKPCLRVIKRTRKNTLVIGNWQTVDAALKVTEVEDCIATMGMTLINELTLTSGIQLALPLE